MGFFEKIKEGFKKTRDSMMGMVEQLLNSFTKIDEEFFEELEETLIMCDIGAAASEKICETLRSRVKEKGITDPTEIKQLLKDIIVEMLGEDKTLDLSTKPSVILVIGVNGAGKTTTIGKLSYQLVQQGKKVLIAAADTFRAAAIDQLEVWADRAGADIVKHSEGSDPAAVVFDALTAAKARGVDVVICDTAGRLHNKKNLMDELKKINRIVAEQSEGSAVEVLLTLDATTGQNAVNQAKLFGEVADITGIILTKLDGTAKGGIIIPIQSELGIPVKLVGVGEKLDDLQPFHAAEFADALFETESNFEYNYERLTEEESSESSEEIISEATEEISEEPEVTEEVSEAIEEAEEILPEETAEESGEEITEEAFEEIIGETDEEIPEEASAEPEPSAEKKHGAFDFLFKEITFGKKKKGGE